MKYALIDTRLRKEEKFKLVELGYNLVCIPRNENVYEEISSHVDIFCAKIGKSLILEPSIYDDVKKEISNTQIEVLRGRDICRGKYPADILYNVCVIGNKVVHNFKYTDNEILEKIEELKLEKIDVSQGYSNCSIAVIDENTVITSDKKIGEVLLKKGIDVLLVENNLDIKLLNKEKYSNMTGFVGGAISRLGDNIFVTGDLSKIDKDNKIRRYIENKGLNIIEFKRLDVIDYGGILEIEG